MKGLDYMTDFRKLLVIRVWGIYGMEHDISIQFEDNCDKYPNNDKFDKILENYVIELETK